MWPFTRSPRKFAPQDDCVWYSYNALRAGVAKQAAQAAAAGPVLVVPHFPDSADDAEVSLLEAGMEPERISDAIHAAPLKQRLQDLGRRVCIVQAANLKPSLTLAPEPPREAKDPNTPALTIIAWERHPLRTHDDVITSFAAELDAWFACTLTFHVALDTPPMSLFAGDTTQAILGRLGMKENDSIQHAVLSKSIAKAQLKVAEKTPIDPKPTATSAADWLAAMKLANTASP